MVTTPISGWGLGWAQPPHFLSDALVFGLTHASNQLGVAGTEALMAGLMSNSALTALSLRENDIQLGGARAAAEVLKANAVLSTLWLGKNRMGDEGVTVIVNALLTN